MRRKHPLLRSELEIGKRLALARRSKKCPRRYLAQLVGVDPSTIKRIELGRSALRYPLARLVIWELDISPLWLATGEGSMHPGLLLPDNATLSQPQDAHFSLVFRDCLASQLKGQTAITPSVRNPAEPERAGQRRAFQMEWLFKCLSGWAIEIPDDRLADFLTEVQSFVDQLSKNYPRDDWQNILSRRIAAEAHGATVDSITAKKEPQSNLTNITVFGNIPDVEKRMPELLKTLRAATSSRGGKTALANRLGVPLANVSQWLSGEREPGGENTLRLLNWLREQAEEAKQKSPGGAINTTGAKTRKRKSKYEKPKSSPLPK